MSTTTFIDTLFVVALVNERDQHHKKASELADLFVGRQLLTTDAVLIEIGNALARNFKPQAVEIIGHFLTSADAQIVRRTRDLFDDAFSLFKAHVDKQWGITDCISFVVMRRAGVTDSLTFDQHFVQAGYQALMRESS